MKKLYKGLICTHHLFEWAGSECVTIEIIEELQNQGCELFLYCPFFSREFVNSAIDQGVTFIREESDIDISLFDFIYTHHQIPSRFLLHQPLLNSLGRNRPVFIYNHLSPYEPFEFPGPWCEEKLADIVLCNSRETSTALRDFGSRFNKTLPFYNPAPREFATETIPSTNRKLNHVLAISNHLPEELSEAFDLLRDQGVEVTHLGKPHTNRRILPEDIRTADAVITIGKSVQYALRGRRPVFCYDWFGGPGWLDENNFSSAASYNFSGRSHPHKSSPQELAASILSGYSKALEFATELPARKLKKYMLENSVKKLLKAINRVELASRTTIDSELIKKLSHEAKMYKLIDREYKARLSNESTFNEPPQSESTDWISNLLKGAHSSEKSPANIRTQHLRDPEPGKSRVIAIFAFRYDAHLVPGLLENISPFVHGWIAWDDRQGDDEFTGDAVRRQALFDAASEMGADWILAADPDERFEKGLAECMEALTNDHGPVCWTFDCRELFEPLRFRVDGLWHDRPRVRLYPCSQGMEPDTTELHSQWTKNENRIPSRSAGLCFYHLRMSTRARRRHRRDLYAAADPERQFQNIGYDYIDDDRGMQLEQIHTDRMYYPLEKEDHGLWAPDIEQIGEPEKDPLKVQLRRLETTLFKGGGDNASYLATDIYDSTQQDIDLGMMAVELCLRVGNSHKANRICKELVDLYPKLLLPKLMYSRVLRELGEKNESQHVAQTAIEVYEYNSVILQQQALRATSVNEKLYSDDALWRRWTQNAELFNGVHVTDAEMAVVVIGFKAPPELADAVASLRDQDEEVEIIVVNSGGGDVAEVLKDHLEYIRLIAVEERLFAGSARNIGIDASVAPYIAFLASDCTATQGWITNRMLRHKAGAAAVASAVIPAAQNNDASLAAHYLMHWRRRPVPEAPLASRYGVSCSRRVFESCGYFPTGLRLGEDTSFNDTLHKSVGVAWAPDVITTHRYPTDEKSLLDDMRIRGRRRAQYPPFSNPASTNELDAFTSRWSESSIALAVAALRESSTIDEDTIDRVSQLIRSASKADVSGVKEGWNEVHDARQCLIESNPEDKGNHLRRLEQAVTLWPQSVKPRLLLAQHLTETQTPEDSERAVTLMIEATSLTPTSAESLSKLCKTLEDKGDYESALRYAEIACMMSPTELPFWWELNGVTSRTGNRQMQIFALQNILIINPANQDAQSILAQVYNKNGEPSLADMRCQMAEMLE